MSSVSRLGDKSTGHGCCYSPTVLVQSSSNVFVNGKGCARLNDKFKTHGGCQDHSPDTDFVAEGSSSVFVNGKPIARVGDKVGPRNSELAEGSPNVFAGG